MLSVFHQNEDDDFLRNLAKSRQQSRGKSVQVNGIWTSQPFCTKVTLKPRPPSASSLGFARKIQNEFHQKEKPSRLVQSYEYFDKLKKPRTESSSKRAQYSRPVNSSRQPINHLHSSPYDRLEVSSPAENLRTSQNYSHNNNNSNPMSVSIDRKNQSNILRRSMERPNRLSAANPRRISTGDTHRSRSQLRSDSETRKMSYSSSQTRKNSRKNSSENLSGNQNGKLTSKRLQTIKSNKSTEGSKTKDSEENNAEMEDLYVTEGLDDAFYRRIRSWVSEVDKCLRSGDFDRKVVMDSSEMDYPEDPPYSRETSDGLNFRPGNHHTVTVVIADDGS